MTKQQNYFDPDIFCANPLMEDLHSDNAKAIYNYWKSKCSKGALPKRSDLDLLDLTPYLGNVAIYRKDGDNFRLTFVGTKIEANMGLRGFTGRSFSDMENSKAISARTQWLFEQKVPYYVFNQPLIWSQDHAYSTYSVLAMPLVDDTGEVDCVISINEFSS